MTENASIRVKLTLFSLLFILAYFGITYSGLVTIEEVQDFTKRSVSEGHEDDPRFTSFGQKSLLTVSQEFGVPLEVLIEGLGLPQDIAPETILKDFEHGISPKDVEAFIIEGGYDKTPVTSAPGVEEEASEEETDPRFTELGKKSLTAISQEFEIPIDLLISNLELPADIDPETTLRETGKDVSEIKTYLQEQEGL